MPIKPLLFLIALYKPVVTFIIIVFDIHQVVEHLGFEIFLFTKLSALGKQFEN